MLESLTMLTIWRRHTAQCPHRDKGRDFLKCNCPIWADGYVNGKRTLRKSLGTRDMARARKKAVALESPDALVYKPLGEGIQAYLTSCQYLSSNTQRKYRNRLEKQLLPFCQGKGVEVVRDVTVEILDSFRAARNLAPSTSGRELETLRQFFSFCVDRKWIGENPAKKIKPPRNVKPAEVVPYTDEEIAKFITAAGEIGRGDYERRRAYAAVLLFRHTGLRISDVAVLRRDSIQNGCLRLHTKKTGGLVMLPLPEELLHALRTIPTPRGADSNSSHYFFINGTGSQRTAVSVMERCLRAVFKASGVIGAHPHRFRHTLATKILANGGTMTDVATVLGISEAVAAKHYAKWSPARQDRVATLMRVLHLGTNQARRKKLVVIA